MNRFYFFRIAIVVIIFFCASFAFSHTDTEIQQAIDFAFSLENQNDYTNAISQFKKVLKMMEASKESSKARNSLGKVFCEIGKLYLATGNYREAESYYNRAILAFDERYGTRENIDSAEILYELASIHRDAGQIDEALSYINECVRIVEKCTDNPSFLGSVTMLKSSILYSANRYNEALEEISKTESYFRSAFGENSDGMAYMYQALSCIYSAKGDSKRAEIFSKKALDIMEGLVESDSPKLVGFLHNYAKDLWNKGDYLKAVQINTKAVNISTKAMGKKYVIDGAFDAIFLTGDMFSAFGKNNYLEYVYNQEESLKKGLAEVCDMFNSPDMTMGIKSIYPEYSGAKTPDDLALIMYNFAKFVAKYSFGNEENQGVATSCNAIGGVYFRLESYKQAQQQFEQAMSIYTKLYGENHPKLAHIYCNLAQTLFQIGDKLGAKTQWRKAFVSWKTSPNYGEIIEQTKEILSYEINDRDFTRETLEIALNAVERSRFDVSPQKSQILKNALPIFYYGVQFAHKENNAVLAFSYAEAMKSRNFLEQMGTEAALRLDGVTDEEREKYRSISAKIQDLTKQLNTQNEKTLAERDENKVAEIAKSLSETENELSTLESAISKKVPRFTSLRNPSVINAESTQNALSSDSAIIEYVMWSDDYAASQNKGKKSSYCIVISKKKMSVIELKFDFDYIQAVNNIRTGIRPIGMDKNRNYIFKKESTFEKPRNDLYKKLVLPVLKETGDAKKLVIVPDGNLAFLPFDILREKSSKKMFFEQYSFLFSPSISVSSLLPFSSKSIGEMFAFGGGWYNKNYSESQHRSVYRDAEKLTSTRKFQIDSIQTSAFSSDQIKATQSKIFSEGAGEYFSSLNLVWDDLPGTLSEVYLLRKNVFNDGKTQLRVQEEATESSLKTLSRSGELKKYPVLHFACHGYFDGNIAEMCSIVFSEVSGRFGNISEDDGYLTVPEVSLLNLNADIVCLSACETGLGEIRAGDGLVGLSRGFMVSGARNVGVSLWSVDDEATAEFMLRMYQKRKLGLDYADSYQEVKKEFLQNKRWSDPFFWAAFSLYGGFD